MTVIELIKKLEKETPTAEVTVKINFTDRYIPVKEIDSRYIPAQNKEFIELVI